MNRNNQKYVVGVDGGATSTDAVLADLEGKILKRTKMGTSNPRNIGQELAVFSIAKAVKKIVKNIKKEKNSPNSYWLASNRGGIRDKKRLKKLPQKRKLFYPKLNR